MSFHFYTRFIEDGLPDSFCSADDFRVKMGEDGGWRMGRWEDGKMGRRIDGKTDNMRQKMKVISVQETPRFGLVSGEMLLPPISSMGPKRRPSTSTPFNCHEFGRHLGVILANEGASLDQMFMSSSKVKCGSPHQLGKYACMRD